jgi:lysophospholipase L1-like esterase
MNQNFPVIGVRSNQVIDWMTRLLKVNVRVILLTLLMLILFDVALQKVMIPYYLNPGSGSGLSGGDGITVPAIPRLPADDFDTLSLWKNQMTRDDGFKVVFLGDSVVHGGGVPEEKETIPAYFSRQLSILLPDKQVKVYNFSLPGCTPADTYNILRFIADTRPDLVIYDDNIGWFGSSKIMEHPRLADLAQQTQPTAKAARKQEKKTDVLEDALTGWMTDHWALYRNRIFLNYVWFGKPLKEKLKIETAPQGADSDTAQLTNDKEIYRPWYLKNFDVLKKTKGKLGYCSLDQSNQHWVMYNRLLDELDREKIKTVIFMVPRNRPLYIMYNLLDEPVLQKQQARLADAARGHGVAVFDYTFAIDDREFVDSVHLTAQGNRELAERLARDLVKEKVVK